MISKYWVAAIRVRPTIERRAGIGVVIRQQILLSCSVDGAVDGALVGRHAVFLGVVWIIEDARCRARM